MKPYTYTPNASVKLIREQDPLKQGLKHIVNQKTAEKRIREQDPLKQGLKLNTTMKKQATKTIREQDPLKQGLKHKCLTDYSCIFEFASKIH